MTRVVLREAAEGDISAAVKGGEELAARFLEAIDAALLHLETHPSSGSPRYAEALGIANLRSWSADVDSDPQHDFSVDRSGCRSLMTRRL